MGAAAAEPGFRAAVESLSGQNLPDCYQCGECTAGCPVAFAMDLMPNQVSRLVQLDMADEVLHSRTIWLCAGCQTCIARCPKLVDLPRIMDALRQMAASRGIRSPEGEVQAFHDAFLASVERSGRVHEMGMIAHLKLKTGKLLKDVPVGAGMMLKGKLNPLPSPVKDRAGIRRMFEESRKRRNKPDGR